MVAIVGAARRQFKGEIADELYAALVRCGMEDQILAEPQPNPKLAGLTGGYLYAKATALAAAVRVDEALAAQWQFEAAWKNADVVLTAAAFCRCAPSPRRGGEGARFVPPPPSRGERVRGRGIHQPI